MNPTSDSPSSVHLRDYIERQIADERRHRDSLREEDRRLREAERDSIERAMEVWTEEVKRRLLDLNNVHDRADRIAATTISRDTFDATIGEIRMTLNRHEKQLSASEGSGAGIQRFIGYIVAAIMALVAIIALVYSARAHEAPAGWMYDNACCAGIECEPVVDDKVAATTLGWLISQTGETIPYGDKRLRKSGDEHFHRCRMIASEPLSNTRCLYLPDMDF